MAKKKAIENEEVIDENISIEPLENVMGDRYATYAKYVIQDRAIPDVRDGLKPVQRRIIFSMYKSGNTINKPTKKCAHTVGAVMGTYHPHGDTSIYEALARMSQDWKMRYPLIDFQGNNGSIDGDSPAAYRYTESRLSELSNELVRDIEKDTVDMQLNFDDTEFEPTVLPARFPNLFVNGTEGIAVALATEIPPHNLNEVVDAIIYRIGHKNVTNEDLMQFVQGPDFPGGGIIYRSSGLDSIYTTGRGRIEMAAKTEIVTNKDMQQIIITELPYKAVKIQTVYEIDKIRHSKAIDGILEVRDESDWKGIRIVVDLKPKAKAELILAYLMNKTSLRCNYSANMVAIVNGRPKTLDLLTYVDAYIDHQVDVVTRQSKFDLNKCEARLHIVEGLILASLNINEVVAIIRASKDKADSKINLIKRYNFSNEQAEAIVTMPLYKLSHTDEEILEKEKVDLTNQIEYFNGLLNDPNKLNRAIIKDLKAVVNKYGNPRRTQIIDGEDVIRTVDKRKLISKEEVMVMVTRDGYLKRSSLKSYKSSNESLPGIKDGDVLVGAGIAYTTDYFLLFTNKGNYIVVPVHLMTENKWKDEGNHINAQFTTLGMGEKIIKAFIVAEFRKDLYLALVSKAGQIKRTPIDEIDVSKHSKPMRAMKILDSDEIVGVELLSGNSDILVLSNNGNASLFNENDLTIVSNKAGGVKSMAGLAKANVAALVTFEESEKTKCCLYTDKGHRRIFDASKVLKTSRLGKVTSICPSFKSDVHNVVSSFKVEEGDVVNIHYTDTSFENFVFTHDDLYMTDTQYAKKNISMPSKTKIDRVYMQSILRIDSNNISHPVIEKAPKLNNPLVSEPTEENTPKEEKGNFEQISIFDDLDD
ncbi:MAG: DNA topoisomerase IV subunit A [Bacilli bacterium]|nr:DNA topoisomerase IV subunit A [Bacilli bacterium]